MCGGGGGNNNNKKHKSTCQNSNFLFHPYFLLPENTYAASEKHTGDVLMT